jgi:hypothetical protein
MTSCVILPIFLLFIVLLRYTVIVVEETGECCPLSCRVATPAGWFFMTDLHIEYLFWSSSYPPMMADNDF